MQAVRLLRKLCLVAVLAPLAAHTGEVRISIRIPWFIPAVLAALFPPRMLPVSEHHIGTESARTVFLRQPGVAIDARTFVAGGIHYRLHGLPPSEPGSAEEARARAALQSLLDSGPLKARMIDAEPSGIRIVTLERNG